MDNIELLDSVEVVQKKEHTVQHGYYRQVIDILLGSDKPALVIHCDSVDEAVRKTMGFRNIAKPNKLPIKVSRKGADVFVSKEEINGN